MMMMTRIRWVKMMKINDGEAVSEDLDEAEEPE